VTAFGARGAGLLVTVALVAACSAGTGEAPASAGRSAAPTTVASMAPSSSLPELEDGPVAAGRYVIMPAPHGWIDCEGDPLQTEPRPCAGDGPPGRYMQVEITVPPDWQAMGGGSVLVPSGVGSADGPDGAGFEIGWTDPWAGLHSDPCLPVAHRTPDIAVGPTVDDFVDAVMAHPALDVTEPVEVELGGYRGQFLTLTTPSDISGCKDWRPWEPGIYAHGPSNIWNLWVIDVDGYRMIVLAFDFAATPLRVRAELRAMVESIRFVP
jgi:hypothetical protein